MALGKYAVDYEERIDYSRLRAERLAKAREQIHDAGVGALITWDEANIRYITSYYVTTPMRPAEMQCVFLPRNGEPILFGGGTPSETERRMPWMRGRVRPSISMFKMSSAGENDLATLVFVDTVKKLMAEHGVSGEPLAIDGTTCGLVLERALTHAGIVTVYGKPIMDRARMIKTADEAELMRITCGNAESAFAAIADAIRSGVDVRMACSTCQGLAAFTMEKLKALDLYDTNAGTTTCWAATRKFRRESSTEVPSSSRAIARRL